MNCLTIIVFCFGLIASAQALNISRFQQLHNQIVAHRDNIISKPTLKQIAKQKVDCRVFAYKGYNTHAELCRRMMQ